MSEETKTPQAGEYWVSDDGSIRRKIKPVDPPETITADTDSEMSVMEMAQAFSQIATLAVHPDDILLNPVPGKVVATGTVMFTPVTPTACVACGVNWALDGSVSCRECYEHAIEATGCPVESPDDWVTQNRCAVRCGSDEVRWSEWEPDEWVVPSGFWSEREIHGYVDPDDGSTLSIRCLRKYLPVEVLATPETITADTDNMAAIIAEHTQQVRELTQRIDDLVQQVNERDAVIEKIRTALRQEYSV